MRDAIRFEGRFGEASTAAIGGIVGAARWIAQFSALTTLIVGTYCHLPLCLCPARMFRPRHDLASQIGCGPSWPPEVKQDHKKIAGINTTLACPRQWAKFVHHTGLVVQRPSGRMGIRDHEQSFAMNWQICEQTHKIAQYQLASRGGVT